MSSRIHMWELPKLVTNRPWLRRPCRLKRMAAVIYIIFMDVALMIAIVDAPFLQQTASTNVAHATEITRSPRSLTTDRQLLLPSTTPSVGTRSTSHVVTAGRLKPPHELLFSSVYIVMGSTSHYPRELVACGIRVSGRLYKLAWVLY